MDTLLRIGTRKSALALWQAEHIRHRLLAAWPHLTVELVPFTTRGDRELGKPLPEIGGKGLFTAELEAALRSGAIDIAVHSLKDLPTDLPPDLVVGAVTRREDPRDVLISRHGLSLDALPPNPTVGTSSNRRAAQVRLARPDARIIPLRGNVDTRVRKALDPTGPYDAVVLARAGVVRLGLERHVTQVLPFDVMLPAPGQGALGVQCRAHDERVLALLAPLDDADTRAAVIAERAFLQGLGGGCAMPVAALGEVRDGRLYLRGLFVTDDGVPIRVEGDAAPEEAEALGYALAEEVRSRATRSRGAVGQARAGANSEQPADAKASTSDGKPITVLITRAPEQAAPLAERLRSLGFTPILYPTIRIAPPEQWGELDAALRRLADGAYDWLVLTSVNGVRYVWERLAALELTLPDTVKIAVIGPATAAALRERGRAPALIPDEFVAESLADALGEVHGLRFLLARADRARPTLRERLQAQGAQVDEVVAYRTVVAPPADPPPDVDIITFTSPSTVHGFVAALRGASLAAHTRVVCIGPITARAAREAGLRVDAVAEEYTIEGVIAAVVKLSEEAALKPAS